MKIIGHFVWLCVLGSCLSGSSVNTEIEVFENFDDLESQWKESDQMWVINFWATSCPPCVKEMPHFMELENENADLKVLLVSLDRARDLDSRVYPFVEKYGITPEVVVLEDQNYSKWTAKVDTSWYGALPATLILKGEKRMFSFGAYETYEELVEDVNGLENLTN